MPDETEESPARIAYSGEWRIELAESNETVMLSLRYPASASNNSSPTVCASLGLTTEAIAGHQQPLLFELRREAGTFACRGTAGDGRGNGKFRFRPDPAYANAVAETGLLPLTLRQHVQAGLFDVPSGFLKAIVATGIPHITFDALLSLKLFRVTLDDVNELQATFPGADLNDVLALRMAGVTANYVASLRRASIGHLSVDNVVALRAAGIDQVFIERLVANGLHGLSIDEVAGLYSEGA